MSQFQPIAYTAKGVQKIHHMPNLLKGKVVEQVSHSWISHSLWDIKKIKAKESNSLIGEELQADLSFSKTILLA